MNICILGGGIGGLSAAIALKQEGFDVSIYERHNKPTEIGAGIVCWPNASFILKELGILNEVSNVSGSINYMNRFSHRGEPLGSLNINELSKLMKYPSYSILRKDLIDILTQRALSLDISIYYDYKVVQILDKKLNTSIVFSNNKKIQADVIVGADGRMNSKSRKYVNGVNTPIYQGFVNWIGVIEHESMDFSELSVSDYWGVGKRFGIVPISKTKAYWAGGATSKNIEKINSQDFKNELGIIFNSWPDVISEIINETPLSLINKIYVHDHDPIDLWHKNNLVLLGDAAHSALPTSGQGACQALEDAWNLAKCLKANTNDIEKAFELFTELRKTKTASITIGGRHLASSIFNEDEEFCKNRNFASKNSNSQHQIESMAKVWSSNLLT